MKPRGQALVETAMLAPFLILLTVGIVDVGRFTYQAIEIGNSARAGAEYGSQNLGTAIDKSGMQNAAVNDANVPGFVVANVTASHQCVYVDNSTSSADNCPALNRQSVYVSVESADTFHPFLRYIGLPSQITIDKTMTIKVSQ